MKREFIVNILKGVGIGSANVVPGVSGGTIAILTGIYSRIVGTLNAVTEPQTWKALMSGRFKEFWKHIDGTFLSALALGVVISVLSLARIMTIVLERFPIFTWAFFFGLILASAFLMFKDVKGWTVKDVVILAAGAAIAVFVCTLPEGAQTSESHAFIFLCGAISICTMILPGVSGSFVLLILGKYDFIMQAISSLDIPVLATFCLGCVVGLLAFAKFLHWLLRKWEKGTMLFLLGFVLGSLVKVWPWNNMEQVPGSELHIPGAIAACLCGAALVLGIQYLSKSK